MRFSGKDINECLKKASSELSIEGNNIKYTIIKESKKLFNKYCEIDVEDKKEETLSEVKSIDYKEENNENIIEEKVVIEGNKIILKTDESESFKVIINGDIEVKVNDKPIDRQKEISSKDKITYSIQKVKGERSLEIIDSAMEAKLTIKYSPTLVGRVQCKINNEFLEIKSRMVEQHDVNKYTKKEVKDQLLIRNIVYGIDEEAIEKAVSQDYGVNDLIIVKGKKPVDDEDDKINVLFSKETTEELAETLEKIDYRNSHNIPNVTIGDVLGELIVGKEGYDGIDIYGNEIPRKLKKSLQIKVGVGCTIKDNKVVAIIDGQPSVKSDVFYVHKVYKVDTDVDLKSGNINFVGDVIISKNITEGMTVEAGNFLTVMGNIEHAKIKAQGDSSIAGSIINSQISIGSKDIVIQKKLNDLEELGKEVSMLIQYTNELKEKQNFNNISDGEIIKTLIDSNCRNIIRKGMAVMNYKGDSTLEEINNFIRKKIIGLGPFNIRYSNELYNLEGMIKDEIKPLSESLYIPVSLHINYVQDSTIDVTGNVYIDGKGQYTSKITSFGDIIFTKSAAVSRGGELIAKGNIRAKVLGSSAGISTILRVPKDKEITADVAYHNTTFFFGERKYTIESPSKSVKAYMDSKGEIVVEKLLL